MSNPIPAQLVLFGDLPSTEVNTKVRLLGCVSAPYCASSGHLAVQHPTSSRLPPPDLPSTSAHVSNYPKLDKDIRRQSARPLTVLLDISHVDLRGCGKDVLSVGSWLNVIGYVTSNVELSESHGKAIRMQALMIWEASGIDPKAFDDAVMARKQAAQVLSSVSMTG